MNVLVLVPHYLPGFKAGGPIRSVANLVDRLGDEFNFRIITSDRDVGEAEGYHGVDPAHWQRVGRAAVRYVSPARWSARRLAEMVRESGADVLYVNSFFNPRTAATALALARCGMLPDVPMVIAPRGEFSPAALALKPWKKQPYLAAMKSLGAAHRVLWHAASDLERRHVLHVMGSRARVLVAPNLSIADGEPALRTEPKRPGELRLAFLSRITPKKNLLGAIDMLADVRGRVSLDVWGPIEDSTYWRRCLAGIACLPGTATVAYRGVASPQQVASTLAQYDALLLPTHGENYGHVIVEALAAACPVVISDRTPWRHLARLGVGWDLPLEDPNEFRQALAALAAMDEAAHGELRRRAARFGRNAAISPATVDASRQLFRAA